MAKKKTEFVCSKCEYKTIKYMGRCPNCNSFGSFEEIESGDKSIIHTSKTTSKDAPQKLNDVKVNALKRYVVGISEFDRVMGGGIVVDSVNVITAPPGTGKSTLLLEVANKLAEQDLNVLYISGEESESQIKLRADRILGSKISDNLYVKSETNLQQIEKDIKSIEPNFMIIDSVQTLYTPEIDNLPGGDKQINLCSSRIRTIAKNPKKPIATFFVGQMTKEDELRGSREFEHMVDAVFRLEGEQGSSLRMLRGSKNRFGSVEEVGLFEMKETGLEEISDPSKYFITERSKPISGVALTMIKEGSRNIVIEVESLTETNSFSFPMRVGEGISKEKLQILIAILEKRAGVSLKKQDLYLKISGDLKPKDTAINLGIVASMFSSAVDIPIDNKTVFLGEVSLTGELKRIQEIDGRLKDLDRMGFETAIIPRNNMTKGLKFKNLKVKEVNNLTDVLRLL